MPHYSTRITETLKVSYYRIMRSGIMEPHIAQVSGVSTLTSATPVTRQESEGDDGQ